MTFIPLRRATRTLFRSRSKVWHEARSIHNAPSRKFVSGSAAAMQVEGASPLVDTFGREHNYLRISLTERCNLRCQYCMPDEGIDLTPNPELLTKDEIVRLARLFVDQGVDKIRLTGGEPLVHPHVEEICEEIGGLEGLNTLAITTNGIVLSRKLPRLVDAGVNAFNISLDSLVDRKFEFITRRKGFSRVMSAIEDTINAKAGPVKVNCVVTRGFNEDEVVDFVEYTRDKEVEVRFIEYMPFDGNKWNDKKLVKYTEMLSMIDDAGLVAHRVKDHPNDTSKTYQVEGFKGKIGFITSMSDNFCSTCNRIRLTADGNLKVCLFGPAEVSLRDVMREHSIPSGESGDVGTLALDEAGKEALVDVIGCAVRGKKARHAGRWNPRRQKGLPTPQPSSLVLRLPKTIASTPTSDSGWTFVDLLPSHVPKAASVEREKSMQSRSSLPAMSLSVGLTNRVPLHQQRRQFFSKSARPDAPSQQQQQQQQQQQVPNRLTHVDTEGRASMVDVGDKDDSTREAIASGRVWLGADAFKLVEDNSVNKKGDALTVAQLAGIMGAKHTPLLIPLCHSIFLSSVKVDLTLDQDRHSVVIRAVCRSMGKTGVEMEALTAVSVSALTVYDMCKAVSKSIEITDIRLDAKSGGKSGDYSRERE